MGDSRTDEKSRTWGERAGRLLAGLFLVIAGFPMGAAQASAEDESGFWGDDDNVAVAYYRDYRGDIVATIVGTYEVTGYPAAGEAGTVTVSVDFDITAVNEFALWNAPQKSTMMVGTQTATSLYSSSNLSPTEHLYTASGTSFDLLQSRDYAWIRFQVDETWNREVYVQETGSWSGPDEGKVAPPVEEGETGVTITLISAQTSDDGLAIDYSIEVAVDPTVTEIDPEALFRVSVEPGASPRLQTIPPVGGAVVFDGSTTEIEDNKAYIYVQVSAFDVYGQFIHDLTRQQVVLEAPPPVRHYVALGDSFQAGEGTDTYFPSTDALNRNMCHRSPLAFPSLLTERGAFGPLDLEFWACGGSTIEVLYEAEPSEVNPPWDDPIRAFSDVFGDSTEGTSALGRLGSETGVVTVGVGGNDVGFGQIMEGCVKKSAEDSVGNKNPATFWWPDYSCEDDYAENTELSIDRLRNNREYSRLFYTIAADAKNAEVIVLGYPRFFPDDAATSRCQHVRWTDQLWINSEIKYLNDVIEDEARGMPRTTYVDIFDVGDGHELCVGDSSNWFMKGVSLSGGSFHPNVLGHKLIANALETQVGVPSWVWTGSIRESENLGQTFIVPRSTFIRASVGYPGSDVMITLISPSGEVFDRTSGQANLSADRGDTWETIEIAGPEVGDWTVELLGVDTRPDGDPFEVYWYLRPLPNERPIAVGTIDQHGGLVYVDGSGSYDPDGSIVEMGFDFGDGTVVYGETASHVYEDWGEALVTMWVKDDRGDYGFAEVGTILDIPEYEFDGFWRFMSHRPVKDWGIAGHPIYLGFSLGDDFGNDVMMPGSPSVQEVSCETGEPVGEAVPAEGLYGMTPRYIGCSGEYAWIWDTEREWTGTCQTVTFDFNDGSSASHTMDFNWWRRSPWWRIPRSYWDWKHNR